MSERERSLLLSVASDESQPASERCDAARLLTMMMNDVKTCYVVEDCAGNARFLQWLILPDGNDHLHRRFRDWYPVLHFDEALMEFAYVFPKYRGTGVLPYAVELILEKAPRDVIKNIITLIPTHNRNSLRSFINMGFVPQQVRIDTRRFGIPHRSIFSLQSPDQVSALRQRLPESVMHILMKCAVERSNSEAAVTETQFN